MKFVCIIYFILFFYVCTAQNNGVTKTLNKDRSLFSSIDLGKCNWTGGLLYDVWKRNSVKTIPYLFSRYKNKDLAGYYNNFQNVANGINDGFLNGGLSFTDGDFYKWMEAVLYDMAVTKDISWESELDKIIYTIGLAQDRAKIQYGIDFEGYISTQVQLNGGNWMPQLGGGELYNLGHLMSTAATHHRVTGKNNLLDIGRKAGYLIHREIDKSREKTWRYWDHTIIMGAVELFRETNDSTFLDIADYIVNAKGKSTGNTTVKNFNSQVNGPLINQTIAIGHAQRANYLYAGAADLYLEGGNPAYIKTLTTIWNDITTKRLYITGGTGSIHGFNTEFDVWTPSYPNPPGEPIAPNKSLHVTEAYGPDFYLPNEGAYCESCAQCGMALFCWRMLQATGNPKYADLLELEFFNGILSGIGQDGTSFFYTNKLERNSEAIYQMDSRHRTGSTQPEKNQSGYSINQALQTQCCPPNMARLISMSPNFAYAISEKNNNILWVHLYGSNTLNTSFTDGTQIMVEQSAEEFPYEGNINFTINGAGEYGLRLRIPGWAESSTISVKGDSFTQVTEGKYYDIPKQSWSKGDKIVLNLNVKEKIIEGDPRTGEAQTGKVAVKRGPLVYCAERTDNKEEFYNMSINPLDTFKIIFNENLSVYALANSEIYLIPYFSWSNRTDNYMKVWINKKYTSSSTKKIQEDFSFFPNPVYCQLFVRVPSDFNIKNISIFDTLGRQIHANWMHQNTGDVVINVNNIHKGIYSVNIIGDEIVYKKIIKM